MTGLSKDWPEDPEVPACGRADKAWSLREGGTLHKDAQPEREIRAVSGPATIPGPVSSSLMPVSGLGAGEVGVWEGTPAEP